MQQMVVEPRAMVSVAATRFWCCATEPKRAGAVELSVLNCMHAPCEPVGLHRYRDVARSVDVDLTARSNRSFSLPMRNQL